LRSNVAIVWPELANPGRRMLGYVVLKCCHFLDETLRELQKLNDSQR